MLKKAAVVVAAVAGLLALGSPAFASGVHGNSNGVSAVNENNISAALNPCLNGDQVAVGLVAVAVGVLNPTITAGSCNNTFVSGQ